MRRAECGANHYGAPTQPAGRAAAKPTSAPATAAGASPAPTQPAAAQPATQGGQQVTISLSFIATGTEQMAPLVSGLRKSQPQHQSQCPVSAAGHPRSGNGHRAADPATRLMCCTPTAAPAGLHSVFALGKAGYLTDLSQRAWAKDVPPAARDMYFDGNKLYGAPMGLSLVGVVYNKTFSRSSGCKSRSTFGGLVDLCGKVKAAGKIPMALRASTGLYAQAPAASTVYARIRTGMRIARQAK